MPLFSLKSLFSLQSRKKSSARHRAQKWFKPRLDLLEDRRMLAAHTLWVDPNVAAVPNVVFSDIQSAVNAAHTGDTIKVVPGTYNEPSNQVSVNTPGLTIIGGQIYKPQYDSPGPSIVTGATGMPAFALNANNTAVEHFTLESDTAGIETDSSHSGYTILNNIFLDDPIGLFLNTATNKSAIPSTVSGNSFTNDGQGNSSTNNVGIESDGMWNACISNNTFTCDVLDSIYLDGNNPSSNVQITGNKILNDAQISVANLDKSEIEANTIVNPIGDGILLAGAVTKTEVANNNLNTNSAGLVKLAVPLVTASSLFGISLGAASVCNTNDQIVSNKVEGFGEGVSLDDSDYNLVSCNTVWNSLGDGICLDASDYNTVSSNSTTKNGANGIELSDSNCNTVSCNTASYNGNDGILLDPSNYNTVTGNTANYNDNNGIELTGSSYNTVSKNVASYNGSNIVMSTVSPDQVRGSTNNGIVLDDGSDYNTVSCNTADYNLNDGIGVFASKLGQSAWVVTSKSAPTTSMKNNTISGNTTNYNQNDGIEINDSNYDTVSGNCANQNQNDGIEVEESNPTVLPGVVTTTSAVKSNLVTTSSTNGTISGNTTNGNFVDGIELENSCGIVVSCDTVGNNLADGISLITSTYNTLSGNTSTKNGGNGIVLNHSSDNSICKNTTSNNSPNSTGNGIALLNDSNYNTVSGNTANSNGGNGIYVHASTNNIVSGNTANKNAGAGIYLTSSTSSNTIQNNTAKNNQFWDLFDASNPPVQNTWTHNTAGTRSPSNLG